MSNNPTVLSYHESLLRQSDVDLLDGPHWLNDNIISFYFEYLKNTLKGGPSILFISPEVTQCIKLIPNAHIKVFLDPLNARTSRFILFALNDYDCPHMEGGSHWSLLVLSLLDETIYHYDSSGGLNNVQAKTVATKLFSYFNIEGDFIQEQCLAQTNGHDCGIHLIYNAEVLAKHLIRTSSIETCDLTNEDHYQGINAMRQQVKDIIYKLKKEGC